MFTTYGQGQYSDISLSKDDTIHISDGISETFTDTFIYQRIMIFILQIRKIDDCKIHTCSMLILYRFFLSSINVFYWDPCITGVLVHGSTGFYT